MSKSVRIILYVLLFLLSTNIVFAQYYFQATQEVFGKNRIQKRGLEWKTIRTTNFEINYYRGGDELAKKAAITAEMEYSRITDILGYTPFAAMNIFIYNSPKDIVRSNIGSLSSDGIKRNSLNLTRSSIEVVNKGNEAEFKTEIIRQVANLFVYDMLYGGSLKEVLQSSLMLSLPEWYIDGIARYIAFDSNSPEQIELMRATILKNQDKRLNTLKGEDAAIVGQSIWHFIAVKYGQDNISNILNLTRIIRAEESSITSTLGISFPRFLNMWSNFYQNYSEAVSAETEQPKAKTPQTDSELPESKENKLVLKPGEVDTENYEFNDVNVETLSPKEKIEKPTSLILAKRKPLQPDQIKISEPKAFQNILISNEMKFKIGVDPVRRGGASANLSFNDLLENNVIQAGAFMTPSVKNHDIFVDYKNYKSRIDWGFRYDRRSIYFDRVTDRTAYLFLPLNLNLPENPNFIITRRLLFNQLALNASYPFSPNLRFDGSAFGLSTTDINYDELTSTNLLNYYLGGKAELVFDNSERFSDLVEVGTKAKIRLERYFGLNNQQGFNRVYFDARRYQRIAKGLQLAGRVAYGMSSGNAPKVTFLGGTENWINRKLRATDGQTVGVPSDMRDFLFYNFAGSLRGFEFGKLYGTSFVLTNLELRLTVSDYLQSGTINSSILKNLQLVGFNDIGSSWMGSKGPFSRQNSLNTEVIGGGSNPFRATVTNFKNPFLMGYGIGLRTRILNNIIRIDYAWGVEDKEVNSPLIHISLGRDF